MELGENDYIVVCGDFGLRWTRDKVILLERGQVFEIDGKTFFTFGGAASHDIQGRILDREDLLRKIIDCISIYVNPTFSERSN